MAKGYSARRGFSNGAGQAMKQQQMQQQIMKMQEDMQKAQQEVEEKSFTASVGGGAVSATVNGKKEVVALSIKPEAVDPEDVETLEDMVVAAVNEAIKKAVEKVNELSEDEEMQRIAYLREKAIREENAIYERGIEKGIDEGSKKEKEKIAKKMKNKKIDISEIIEITGLSKEEIEKL